jgi:hypothetical protein
LTEDKGEEGRKGLAGNVDEKQRGGGKGRGLDEEMIVQ